MGFNFKQLFVYATPSFLSQLLYDKVKQFLMFALFVKAWASHMFVDHVHACQAVRAYHQIGAGVLELQGLIDPHKLSSLDGIGNSCVVVNRVNHELYTGSSSGLKSEDSCAAAAVVRLASVPSTSIRVDHL